MFHMDMLSGSFEIMWQFLPKRRYVSIELYGQNSNFIFIAVRNPKFKWSTAELLKLGYAESRSSAKGCPGLRETKVRNGGRVFIVGPKFLCTN